MSMNEMLLLHLLGIDPKKPAMAPADATAVARNRGSLSSVSPEQAESDAASRDFALHNEELYGADHQREDPHTPEGIIANPAMHRPIFSKLGSGADADSAFDDVTARAQNAVDARKKAERQLATILAAATKQSGQRKVP